MHGVTRKRNQTTSVKRKREFSDFANKRSSSIRRKGLSFIQKSGNLTSSLGSFTNLRRQIIGNSQVIEGSGIAASEKKIKESDSVLLQSQTIQTNLTIVNSETSQNTLISQVSQTKNKKPLTKSLEPIVKAPPGVYTPGKLLKSTQFKEDIIEEKKNEIKNSKIIEDDIYDKKDTKKVHFAEDDILSESSRFPISETDSNSEVWFNDTARIDLLETFFADEENIIEFIITIYALIKFFNKSYFIEIIKQIPIEEQDLLEPEISKISDELVNQVSLNQQDNNMAESNYLLVIQRDLEDTQIRLGETERLLKQQQKEYTDLEIEANNLVRLYEDQVKEISVMRRINEMIQEEVELTGTKFEESK